MADYQGYTSQFEGEEIDSLIEKMRLSEIYTTQEKETLAQLVNRVSELEESIKPEV